MEKKELQEQRMKGYFVQATKELIKGEGLRSVSVRNIADRAGYSFATLYNYFTDAKDLIFLCVKDFQDECLEFVNDKTSDIPSGPEKIRVICKAYVSYFVQYPGIFDLFFLEKTGNIGQKQKTSELISTFLDRLCAAEWEFAEAYQMMTKEEIAIKRESLMYITSGMLLFYMNRDFPGSYTDFMKKLEQQIEQILPKP